MRRFMGLLLAILLVLQPIQLEAAGFRDVAANDWYYENISRLVRLGGFSGYPDGTFKPSQTMTKAEFIKATVTLLGYDDIAPTRNHWASGYVDKALKLKILCSDMTNDLDGYITRYDMARISSRVLAYQNLLPDNTLLQYSRQIKDLNKIPSTSGDDLKTAVLHSYANGIITGYPDGTFSGSRTLTRGEAASVLIRLADKDMRVVPAIVDYSTVYAQQVLELVNVERTKAGLKPLVLDQKLSYVATEKSKDMAVSDYFSHTSPNYGSPFDMMKEFGITYRAAGENIAMGFRTAETVMDGWMNSPGHKANILNEAFGRIGIGVYFGDSVYWTQMFID